MFRAVNEYMAKLNITTDAAAYEKMAEFLADDKRIAKNCIKVNYNRYIVDIRMNEYSVDAADKLFRDFVAATAYPYSHITVRYNEEKRVRYRYSTCNEDKTGIYMDVIISAAGTDKGEKS